MRSDLSRLVRVRRLALRLAQATRPSRRKRGLAAAAALVEQQCYNGRTNYSHLNSKAGGGAPAFARAARILTRASGPRSESKSKSNPTFTSVSLLGCLDLTRTGFGVSSTSIGTSNASEDGYASSRSPASLKLSWSVVWLDRDPASRLRGLGFGFERCVVKSDGISADTAVVCSESETTMGSNPLDPTAATRLRGLGAGFSVPVPTPLCAPRDDSGGVFAFPAVEDFDLDGR